MIVIVIRALLPTWAAIHIDAQNREVVDPPSRLRYLERGGGGFQLVESLWSILAFSWRLIVP